MIDFSPIHLLQATNLFLNFIKGIYVRCTTQQTFPYNDGENNEYIVDKHEQSFTCEKYYIDTLRVKICKILKLIKSSTRLS